MPWAIGNVSFPLQYVFNGNQVDAKAFCRSSPHFLSSCSWTENRIWTQIWHLNKLSSFPSFCSQETWENQAKNFLTHFHWFSNTKMYIFKRIILLKIHNVPHCTSGREEISFSHGNVFLHVFIPICLPSGSQAELTVGCGLSLNAHSCLPAQVEPKPQPGRAQGHQRWDKSQSALPSTSPESSWGSAPQDSANLCPPTGSGRGHMDRTTPVVFMLAVRELLASARTHWKWNKLSCLAASVWEPGCFLQPLLPLI